MGYDLDNERADDVDLPDADSADIDFDELIKRFESALRRELDLPPAA